MIYFIFISQLHTPGRMSAVVYGTVIHKNQLDSCDLMCHQLWRLNLQLIFDVSLFSIPSSNKFAKISSGFISKWSGMICSWQREVARLMNHFLEWYTRVKLKEIRIFFHPHPQSYLVGPHLLTRPQSCLAYPFHDLPPKALLCIDFIRMMPSDLMSGPTLVPVPPHQPSPWTSPPPCSRLCGKSHVGPDWWVSISRNQRKFYWSGPTPTKS